MSKGIHEDISVKISDGIFDRHSGGISEENWGRISEEIKGANFQINPGKKFDIINEGISFEIACEKFKKIEEFSKKFWRNPWRFSWRNLMKNFRNNPWRNVQINLWRNFWSNLWKKKRIPGIFFEKILIKNSVKNSKRIPGRVFLNNYKKNSEFLTDFQKIHEGFSRIIGGISKGIVGKFSEGMNRKRISWYIFWKKLLRIFLSFFLYFYLFVFNLSWFYTHFSWGREISETMIGKKMWTNCEFLTSWKKNQQNPWKIF